MTIEIEDRLYNDFRMWAQANNMTETDMQKYIVKAFRDKFNLDKYGDLNDKLVPKPTEEEKPKRKTTTKQKTESTPQPEPPVVELKENTDQQPSETPTEEKPKRKTKVLASK